MWKYFHENYQEASVLKVTESMSYRLWSHSKHIHSKHIHNKHILNSWWKIETFWVIEKKQSSDGEKKLCWIRQKTPKKQKNNNNNKKKTRWKANFINSRIWFLSVQSHLVKLKIGEFSTFSNAHANSVGQKILSSIILTLLISNPTKCYNS